MLNTNTPPAVKLYALSFLKVSEFLRSPLFFTKVYPPSIGWDASCKSSDKEDFLPVMYSNGLKSISDDDKEAYYS